MKKILFVLSLLVVATSVAMALDGDTYRAEREHTEALKKNGYAVETIDADGNIVEASSETKTKVKRKRRWFAPDPDSYYHFGAFTKFKGSNGH